MTKTASIRGESCKPAHPWRKKRITFRFMISSRINQCSPKKKCNEKQDFCHSCFFDKELVWLEIIFLNQKPSLSLHLVSFFRAAPFLIFPEFWDFTQKIFSTKNTHSGPLEWCFPRNSPQHVSSCSRVTPNDTKQSHHRDTHWHETSWVFCFLVTRLCDNSREFFLSVVRLFSPHTILILKWDIKHGVSMRGHPSHEVFTPHLSRRSLRRPSKLVLGVLSCLRCFQQFCSPNVASQHCPWQDNWSTRGSSFPVLSYKEMPPSILSTRKR